MSKDEEEEEAQSRGFKVADRRRFVDRDDEGEAQESAEPHARESVEAQTPESTEPHAGESVASDAPEPSPAPDPTAASAGEKAAGGTLPEMSFGTFVISLMTQALMHLGEVADQEGHHPARDLPAAKQMIDLLGILSDKTKGNLDANEEQLLGNMLYDLRMRYVEVSHGS